MGHRVAAGACGCGVGGGGWGFGASRMVPAYLWECAGNGGRSRERASTDGCRTSVSRGLMMIGTLLAEVGSSASRAIYLEEVDDRGNEDERPD